MKSIFKLASIILLTSLLFSGCNLGAQAPQAPTIDAAAASTQAFETISVTLTLGALGQLQAQPTNTKAPTIFLPTATEEPTATMEPPIILDTEALPTTEEVSTETPTPTTSDTPMLHVTEASNCRAGPNPTYGVEGYITTDMKLPVRGINVGHSWWWVDNPTYPGYHCWVWKWTSVVEGDTSNVPVYYDPWTPTPGKAKITVDISGWTGNVREDCPARVTAVGIIHTNRGGQVRYEWVKKWGVVVDKGWVTIAADGSAVVTTSFRVSNSGNGSLFLRVIYPTKVETRRVFYTVKCTN